MIKKRQENPKDMAYYYSYSKNAVSVGGFIMQKNKIDMCNGPILKQMIMFCIPILLTGILQQFFNSADVILASRLATSGSDTVAAVSTATVITKLIISFFMGCSTGSVVAVTHAIGSKNKKLISETVHTAMFLSVIIGAILTFLGITFSKSILNLINTPENIIKQATLYLQTYFLSMIPLMVYNFGAAILRAVGETKKPLFFLFFAGPIKLILTIVFVSGLKLDVIGLSLATACSMTISAVLATVSLFRRNDDCKLRLNCFKLSLSPLKKILRLGIPSGIQGTTFSLSNIVVQSSVNSLSYIDGFITGNAAVFNIESFSDIFTSAFYQCALNFTGHNIGAKNYIRVKQSLFASSFLSTLVVSLYSITVVILAKPILNIYITDSEQAIEWGVIRITFVFIPLIFQGLMDTTAGTLRGMGVSLSNTVISLLGVCGFRILWCLTVFQMPQFHTPQILYISYPVSWIITYIMQIILYNKVFKKMSNN